MKALLLHCSPGRGRHNQARIEHLQLALSTNCYGSKDIDIDQLSLIEQMLVEKVETRKVHDGEMADIVPEDELENEIQCTDEYKERV